MKNGGILSVFALTLLLCLIAGASAAENTSAANWYEKGNLSYQQEKYDDAIKAFKSAIEEDPKDVQAWFKLGSAYLQTGDAPNAYLAYENATILDPKNGDAYANMGLLLLFTLVPPQPKEALKSLENATELIPDDAGIRINKGIAHFLLKEYDSAITEFEAAIEKQANNDRGYYWLGNAKSDSGSLDEGLAAYTKAVEINPEFKDAWFAKGSVEAYQQKNEEAEKSFDKVLGIKGDYAEPFRSAEANDAEVWYNKGVIKYNLDVLSEAETAFDKAIELNPAQHRAYYYKGLISFAKDDMPAAQAALDKATSIKDQFGSAWYWKGRVALKEQKFDEGITDLTKATEIDGNLTDAWYYLGGVLGDKGSYAEAVAAFTNVTEQTKDFADAWYFKGLNEYQLQLYPEAIDSLQQALSLTSETFTPDQQSNAWYIIGMSRTSAETPDNEGALTAFNESVALNASNIIAQNAYGTILNELKQYEKALTAFEQAVAIDDKSAENWFNIGNVQTNLNLTDKAVGSYDKAIAIEPSPRAFNAKGKALLRLGQNEKAIEAFDEGIKLDQGIADLWYNKAFAQLGMNKFDDAMTSIDKALELDSTWDVALKLKEQIAAKDSSGAEISPQDSEGQGNLTPDSTKPVTKAASNNLTLESNITESNQ
ncbi:MAG TPA: tetratricopeptide repeat protein [Methanospirillum sp.]|nr:tetratricopeptide repeat protein [Methanospirillum sp.]